MTIINIRYFYNGGNIQMDMNQLQAFDQVVRQGSFSKASRSLDISQPTISLRIQALEQIVGGALFIRGGSRLELTELGRKFLPYARQALNILATGIEVAQLTQQGKLGRIMIGALPTLVNGFFATTLARLHVTHPHLDIAVHTGHNQQLVEMLYDSFVHIGLMSSPFFSPNLKTLLSIQEPLLVVCQANHPLALKDGVDISELKAGANPFFHIDWSPEANRWQSQVFSQAAGVVEIPPQTARDLLVQGIGVALLTRSLINDDLQAGRLVAIPVRDMPHFLRE